MSDNFIVLIPLDPRFVPDASRRETARRRFAAMAWGAAEVEMETLDETRFFDCGENFERVLCPSCRSEIPEAWWKARMSDDQSGETFRLEAYVTPCCAARHDLNQLVYQWNMGFARFALRARNPRGEIDDGYRWELENVLGVRLRLIHARY